MPRIDVFLDPWNVLAAIALFALVAFPATKYFVWRCFKIGFALAAAIAFLFFFVNLSVQWSTLKNFVVVLVLFGALLDISRFIRGRRKQP